MAASRREEESLMEIVLEEEAKEKRLEMDTGDMSEKVNFQVAFGMNNTAIDLECRKRNGKFENSSRVAKRLRKT